MARSVRYYAVLHYLSPINRPTDERTESDLSCGESAPRHVVNLCHVIDNPTHPPQTHTHTHKDTLKIDQSIQFGCLVLDWRGRQHLRSRQIRPTHESGVSNFTHDQ